MALDNRLLAAVVRVSKVIAALMMTVTMGKLVILIPALVELGVDLHALIVAHVQAKFVHQVSVLNVMLMMIVTQTLLMVLITIVVSVLVIIFQSMVSGNAVKMLIVDHSSVLMDNAIIAETVVIVLAQYVRKTVEI
jgi:hypothetical protein